MQMNQLKRNASYLQYLFCSTIEGTWVHGGAVVADVQVQAGDEGVVGGLLDVVLIKVLTRVVGGAAGRRRGVGPQGVYARGRWGSLQNRHNHYYRSGNTLKIQQQRNIAH
jgi:hypothetical protein